MHDRLYSLLLSLSSASAGNRLMAVEDRVLALAAWGCDSHLRRMLLASIPGRKRTRVDEELQLLERRRFSRRDTVEALATVVARLEGRPARSRSGYLRPSGRGD